MIKKYSPVLLFIGAFVLRAYRFGDVPSGFNQDEAMAAYEAWSLMLYGTDRFGMALPVYFTAWEFAQMNVLQSYLMVPFFKLLGFSVVAARLPMLFISMLGLFALYDFSNKMFGSRTAWIVLAFAAVCPWHIMQARWALESNMLPHMLMISFWLLYDGLYTRPYKMYLSMIFFALSLYAYGIAFFAVPILLLSLCYFLWRRGRLVRKQILICSGIFASFSWPILAVMFINFFKLPSLKPIFFTIPFFANSVRMNDLLFFSPNIFTQFFNNLSAFLQVVMLQQDGLPWNMVERYGLMYKWSLPLVVIGFIYILYAARTKRENQTTHEVPEDVFITSAEPVDEKTQTGMVMVLCWLGISMLSGLVINHVNANRVNIILYPLLLCAGLGIDQVIKMPLKLVTIEIHARINHGIFSIQYVKDDRQAKRISYIAAVVLSVMLAISAIDFSHIYFRRHNAYLSQIFYADFYKSLAHVQKQSWERLYVTQYTQYPGAWHVSEIITLFGLQIDPSLYQEKIAYHDQYRFTYFQAVPEYDPQALYIFNTHESHFFPEEYFEVQSFGGYGVAAFKR